MERITPRTFLKDAEVLPSVHSETVARSFPIPIALQQQLEDFAGCVLRPHDANGFQIAFDFGGVHMNQRDLRILRSFLNAELIPFATIGDIEALLFITPENSAFTVGLDSCDVSYLGQLQDAIASLLKGTVMEAMIPVLPVRPYSQWHNMTVYDPKQSGGFTGSRLQNGYVRSPLMRMTVFYSEGLDNLSIRNQPVVRGCIRAGLRPTSTHSSTPHAACLPILTRISSLITRHSKTHLTVNAGL